MHSHLPHRAAIGRWLITGAAAIAAAVPAAAAVSASAPPTDPVDTAADASDPADASTPAGSDAASDPCAGVFPTEMAPGSDAPAGSDADTGAEMTPADTGSEMTPADTGGDMAAPGSEADMAAPDTGAAPGTGAGGNEPADAATAPEGSATIAAVAGPVVQTAETALGTILVDADCRALYGFTADVDGESTCVEGCATAWPPLLVAGEEVPEVAEGLDASLFSVVEHPLGPMLRVGDWPLYYFASDVAPGDLNGQGVNDVWFVVAPDGTLIGADGAGTDASAPADTDMAAPADTGAMGSDAATDTEY